MKMSECVFFQLSTASRTGTQFWNRQVDEWQLTGVQAMVVNAIGEEESMALSRMGEKLHLTNATLTGIIDRLEKIGLVERKPNLDDKRSMLVALTPKGQCLQPKLQRRMVEANRSFLGQLSQEEELMLRGLLKRLTA